MNGRKLLRGAFSQPASLSYFVSFLQIVMKSRTQYSARLGRTYRTFARRKDWFLRNASVGTAKNFAMATTAYLSKRTKLKSLPVALKVDISPVCNLRCPFCIHGTTDPKQKRFHKSQRMTVADFSRLVDEVKGRTSAMSLYYLGDPLTHPDLTKLCKVANNGGIYTYVSTNFSFQLSDEKIDELATCGLSHLKICVDGMTQAVYGRTRVGGRIEKVIDNLKRICEARTRLKSNLVVEVQYIQNDGNRHQIDECRELMKKIGVDEMTTFEGADYTMEEIHPKNYEVLGPADSGMVPNCFWPYYFMTIKWNGDVIPCCSFRQDEQYDPVNKTERLLGNIFESSIEEVWNSDAYQNARSFVSNPVRHMDTVNASKEFCFGCKRVCSRRKLGTAPEVENDPVEIPFDPTALPVLG